MYTSKKMDFDERKYTTVDLDRIYSYYLVGGNYFLYKDAIKKHYNRTAKRVILGKAFSLIQPHWLGRCDYVFIGAKYHSLIRSLAGQSSIAIVGGPAQFLSALKLGVYYFSSYSQVSTLDTSFFKRDTDAINFEVLRLSEILTQWGTKALVLVNDSLPLERLWIEAARRASVPSVCLQHGLFSLAGGLINDGKVVDVIGVYDHNQQSILRATGARNPQVFGYFDDIANYDKVNRRKAPQVCLLGQPWVDYYEDKGDAYIETLLTITKCLDNAEVDWIYKPHPSEKKYSDYLKNHKRNVRRWPMSRCVRRCHAFVSISSTALMEAGLSGRVAIQIFDNRLCNENFEHLGYAHTTDFSAGCNELTGLIQSAQPKPILCPHGSLRTRFEALLNKAQKASQSE